MSDKQKLGKYEILSELGRGGFGTVYEAVDTVLERPVALKVLHPNLVNDLSFVSRFRQEAKLAAKLEHPNIVPVYDFDQKDGRFFIAMGLMPGGSLKDKLEQSGAFSLVQSRSLLLQICTGLAYAHDRNIIHRDLKPGNILIDELGIARITDFGFAKAMSTSNSLSLSGTGGILGTPAYMAPELWRGKPATPHSDIYSLGCIAYELLTGNVLFEGETPAEIMTKHIIDRPQLKIEFPENWQKMIESCLAFEPEARYLSINSLLKEITNDSANDNKIIESTPDSKKASVTEEDENSYRHSFNRGLLAHVLVNHSEDKRFSRSTKRKPNLEKYIVKKPDRKKILIKLASFFGAFILIGFLALGLNQYFSKDATSKQKPTVEVTATMTLVHTDMVVKESTLAPSTPSKPNPSSTPEPLSTAISIATSEPSLGSDPITDKNATHVEELFRIGNGIVYDVKYSQDGGTIFVLSSLGVFHYDAQTFEKKYFYKMQEPCKLGSLSRNGELLACGTDDNKIKIFNVSTATILHELNKESEAIRRLKWSPDDKKLASIVSGVVSIWDTTEGVLLKTIAVNQYDDASLEWSPDGINVAISTSRTKIIQIWNVESGNYWQTLEGHWKPVQNVAWSPDGKILASGSADSTIRLWDISNGKEIKRFEGHTGMVNNVTFSTDGKTLASAGAYDDMTVRVWSVDTGEQLRVFTHNNYLLESITFSPNNDWLSWVNVDRAMEWVNMDNGEFANNLELIFGGMRNFSLSQDDEMLAVGSCDGFIRLWNLASGKLIKQIDAHNGCVEKVQFSPDAKMLISSSGYPDKTVRLWNVQSGEKLQEFQMDAHLVQYSPDGKMLATVDRWNDKKVFLWNAITGEQLFVLEGFSKAISQIKFSPEGKFLAVVEYYGSIVRLWDMSNGNQINQFRGSGAHITSMDFSKDGNLFVIGSGNNFIRFMDVKTGKEIQTLNSQNCSNYGLKFSDNGKKLVSGVYSGKIICLWDVDSMKRLHVLEGHTGEIYDAQFSSDGLILASSSWDKSVRLWSVETGRELKILEGHTNSVSGVQFLSNGKLLLSRGWDGTIRLWGIP